MTRAKDISKIVTDADLSGTLDVTGTVTAGGLTVEDTDATITITGTRGTGDTHTISAAGVNNQNLNISADDSIYLRTSDTIQRIGIFSGGDISFYEDTGTTAKLFWDASAERLGIGTTSPATPIHTYSTSPAINRFEVGSNSDSGIRVMNTAGDFSIYTAGGSLRFADNNGSERMRIASDGNVGIGTSSPGYLLDLYGNPGSNAGSLLRLESSITDDNGIIHEQADGTKWFTGQETSNPNDYEFWNYNGSTWSAKLHIGTDGNIGIGTSSPNADLHIVDTNDNAQLALMGDTATNSVYGWVIQQYQGDLLFNGQTATNLSSGFEAMRIDSSGNVGIGLSSNIDRKLHVQNDGDYAAKFGGTGAGDYSIEIGQIGASGSAGLNATGNNGAMKFMISGSEKMRIAAPSGNIGIGTTSPNKPLHVKGTGNNVATFETTLTSDMAIELKNSQGSMFFGLGGGEEFAVGTDADLNGSNSKFVIKNSGNVGIGTTNPANKLHVYGGHIEIESASTDAVLYFDNSGNTGTLSITGSNNDMLFKTNGSERLRIDSNGNLNIGRTSTLNYSFVAIEFNGTTHNGIVLKTTRTTQTGSNYLYFVNSSGTNTGEIQQTGTTTVNYSTTSDYRLKENVTADWDATTRLKQLNPVRFNFIADGADRVVDGFLAHEVQSVVPEAITGTHNEVDDDGNPVYQGIDQSKLVPLLVKTIQELEARITALEGA